MTAGPDELLALYRTQAASMLVYFERRVDDPELAISLLHETMVRASDHRAEFRGDGDAQLEAWVWAIARNTLAEHQRGIEDERRGAVPIGRARRRLTAAEALRIEEIAGRERLQAAAQRGMAQLNDEERTVVQLRVVESHTYEDIAAMLGMSVAAVRARVWHALNRLAAEIDEDAP